MWKYENKVDKRANKLYNKLITNAQFPILKGLKKDMAKQIVVTNEGLKKLQDELEYLKSTARSDVADKIKIARGFGDLSENAEYDAAKNEQAKIEARIVDLEVMLKSVKVIDESEVSSDKVMLGVKVTIRDEQKGEEKTLAIVGTAEADVRNGKISDESPIGKALMGHSVGETVVAETPRGELKFTILDINR